MPEPVNATATGGGLHGAICGFCGKLPARGDFVAAALPRRFIDPWHDWMQDMLQTSRQQLGEAWLPAWLGAPIWRFALSPGICGPDAALGLWMPSVDRAGRHFPLTLAALGPGNDAATMLVAGGGFLAAAEAAGLDALARDLEPDWLAARIAAAAAAPAGDCGADPIEFSPGGALWWSEGSDRVAAGIFATRSLPDGPIFAGMLDAGIALSPAECGEP
jgi:type VI secretion system protein ImpM